MNILGLKFGHNYPLNNLSDGGSLGEQDFPKSPLSLRAVLPRCNRAVPCSVLEVLQNFHFFFLSSQKCGTFSEGFEIFVSYFISSLLPLCRNQMFVSFLLLIQSMSSISHLTFMNVFFVKMSPFKTL